MTKSVQNAFQSHFIVLYLTVQTQPTFYTTKHCILLSIHIHTRSIDVIAGHHHAITHKVMQCCEIMKDISAEDWQEMKWDLPVWVKESLEMIISSHDLFWRILRGCQSYVTFEVCYAIDKNGGLSLNQTWHYETISLQSRVPFLMGSETLLLLLEILGKLNTKE